MRLNRVLLLAATISTMMFALVFTISCSGEDGKNGANGTSCTMEQDGSDWNIICGGEEVGTIHGGNGSDGKDGKDGADGDDCWLNKVAGSYEVRCGAGNGQLKGTLDGCSVSSDLTENKFLVVLTCGKNEVAMCKNKIFDASEDACDINGAISYGGAATFGFCGPDNKAIKYNTKKQYCGYGDGDEEKYGMKATVYDICGVRTDPQPNEDAYSAEQYCRYFDASSKNAKLAGDDTGDFCNGKPLNKDSWKGEYCGYSSIEVKIKSVVTGVCDSTTEAGGPQGPNELGFGQGYCEVKFQNRKNGKTHYSENLCGTSENNKPNNKVWKNEYCGWASTDSDAPTKVYAGLCDNSEKDDLRGPNLAGYNKGYCMADRSDSTTYTEDNFCNEDPTQRPNDGSWKGEYCGFEGPNTGANKVYQGICDDNQGPSQDSYNENEYCRYDNVEGRTYKTDEVCDNGDKINENTWKSEYCGYGDKNATKTSKQTGVCDSGEGPNSVSFGGGYCTVPVANKLTGKTEYTDEFCGPSGKINAGKWNGEYCGYASAKSEDDDKVWTGVCDDGDGKHKGEYNKNGYCHANGEDGVTSFSATFCGTSGKYNEGGWKGEYCFADSRVGKCQAGLKADQTMKSSDNNKCVLPAVLERCVNDSLSAGAQGIKGKFSNSVCSIVADSSSTPGDGSTIDITNNLCASRGTAVSSSRNDNYVERVCVKEVLNVGISDSCTVAAITDGTNCFGSRTSQTLAFTPSPAATAVLSFGNATSTDSAIVKTLTRTCAWENGKCYAKTTQAFRDRSDITTTNCAPNVGSSTTAKVTFNARCVFSP